jgi:hypothetical protein
VFLIEIDTLEYYRVEAISQKAFWHCCRGMVVVFNLESTHSFIFTLVTPHGSTSISQIMAPKGTHNLEDPTSSKSILVPSYDLCPAFIAMDGEQSFAREEDETRTLIYMSLSNYASSSTTT